MPEVFPSPAMGIQSRANTCYGSHLSPQDKKSESFSKSSYGVLKSSSRIIEEFFKTFQGREIDNYPRKKC